jgi:hypothetical protein
VQSLIVLFIAAPPLVRTIFFLPSPERDARRREKARELKRKVDADPSTDAQGSTEGGVRMSITGDAVVTTPRARNCPRPLSSAVGRPDRPRDLLRPVRRAAARRAAATGETTFHLSTAADALQLPRSSRPSCRPRGSRSSSECC